MKILIIKTSSMGDIIHTLPAITDTARAIPDIQIDWVIEEAFAEIPRWHPAIRHVIPVAIRRWRMHPFAILRSPEWKQFRARLEQEQYDCVIDAQGLVKSALVARLANGKIYGFDWSSAREPLATLAYQQKFYISKDQHAVERTRALFGKSLCYRYSSAGEDCDLRSAFRHTLGDGDFGLVRSQFGILDRNKPYVLFLHGTTRDSKHWPDEHWIHLCKLITQAGFTVKVPWYNEVEKSRAEKIVAVSERAEMLPKSNLQGMASVLAQAKAFVAVDTGLGHLGAALNVPGISLYGPTSPLYIGTYGKNQIHMGTQSFADQAPNQLEDILRNISADGVWRELQKLLVV